MFYLGLAWFVSCLFFYSLFSFIQLQTLITRNMTAYWFQFCHTVNWDTFIPKTHTINSNRYGVFSLHRDALHWLANRSYSLFRHVKVIVWMVASLSVAPKPIAATTNRWLTKFQFMLIFSLPTQQYPVSVPECEQAIRFFSGINLLTTNLDQFIIYRAKKKRKNLLRKRNTNYWNKIPFYAVIFFYDGNTRNINLSTNNLIKLRIFFAATYCVWNVLTRCLLFLKF